MDLEELEPRKRKDFEIGDDLSGFSLEELQELVAMLKNEIARIEAELEAKQSSREAADSIFKA
jgi:uncharacterized small protein (DUF1192 family)